MKWGSLYKSSTIVSVLEDSFEIGILRFLHCLLHSPSIVILGAIGNKGTVPLIPQNKQHPSADLCSSSVRARVRGHITPQVPVRRRMLPVQYIPFPPYVFH